MSKDWSADCHGVSKVAGLNGKSERLLLEELGEPDSREHFKLGERVDEFHIELQNHFPLTKPGNSAREVREWTWAAGGCRLTVWLAQGAEGWAAFENSRYSDKIRF